MTEGKKRKFKAETEKVLNILTHSLYADREIFLRELLSNASDALDKLRFLQSRGETVRDAGEPLEIRISVDKIAGVLQIKDSGVGMTAAELADNLGTIAKSGSEDFVRDLESAAAEKTGGTQTPADPPRATEDAGATENTDADPDTPQAPSDGAQIIGRFGIGFYSVFMVAESVEVVSVPAQGGEGPHLWNSDGRGGYSIRALEGEDAAPYKRGTVIRAKIKAEDKEFLEKYRLESVIRKHSNFLPFPIFLEDSPVNTTPALWREPKFSVSKDQYADFYKQLTFDTIDPLDVIHFSADAPIQFNALVFIPAVEQDPFTGLRERRGLDLYARRVLIKRSDSGLVPDYLAFLRGVVDAEDLPLNISRESLQENALLRAVSGTITRRVLDYLEKTAASDKEKYEKFWALHGKYLRFACNDYANRERAAALLRFASSASAGALTGLDEYLGRMKEGQKEIWHLAAPSPQAAEVNPYMERFRRKGIEVLYLFDAVDEFALGGLGEYKGHPFKSVELADGKTLEAVPDVGEATPPAEALNEDEKSGLDKLIGLMRSVLGAGVRDIRLSDRPTGSPAVLAAPEGMTSSMDKLMRAMQKSEETTPRVLELNPDHPLIRSLLRIYLKNPDDPLIPEAVLNLFDNVRLRDGALNDPEIAADRGLKFLEKAVSLYSDPHGRCYGASPYSDPRG
ncbi:MAG: molecular chaperone HtpG [Desulfovibrio sp.]|jgi:molecular chaperone HtpG|nr:molecular chaperone HtpG [Desulfovibrio sp.]